MEYGTPLHDYDEAIGCEQDCDENYLKYVGWEYSAENRKCYEELWSECNLDKMQKKITQLLQGVDPNGRNIIVTKENICHILSEVYSSHRPQVGDIYSRYIQSGIEGPRNDVRDIIDRAVQIIVSQVRNELGMIECNSKLTVWNSLLGDFNEQGLRAHPPIKLNNRRSTRFQFNMNY